MERKKMPDNPKMIKEITEFLEVKDVSYEEALEKFLEQEETKQGKIKALKKLFKEEKNDERKIVISFKLVKLEGENSEAFEFLKKMKNENKLKWYEVKDFNIILQKRVSDVKEEIKSTKGEIRKIKREVEAQTDSNQKDSSMLAINEVMKAINEMEKKITTLQIDVKEKTTAKEKTWFQKYEKIIIAIIASAITAIAGIISTLLTFFLT
ncbi:MAG: hypothetical protein GF308_20810 [Candidatus Heimdallarchaeota archaeon]|nr:hypothetical protein [Candidatus Heimdallarchaeota archaeon]